MPEYAHVERIPYTINEVVISTGYVMLSPGHRVHPRHRKSKNDTLKQVRKNVNRGRDELDRAEHDFVLVSAVGSNDPSTTLSITFENIEEYLTMLIEGRSISEYKANEFAKLIEKAKKIAKSRD